MLYHRRQFLLSIPMISVSFNRHLVAIAHDNLNVYEAVVEHSSEPEMLRSVLLLFPKSVLIFLKDADGHETEYTSINILNVTLWFRADNQKYIMYMTR